MEETVRRRKAVRKADLSKLITIKGRGKNERNAPNRVNAPLSGATVLVRRLHGSTSLRSFLMSELGWGIFTLP